MGVTTEDLELMRSGYVFWNQGDLDGLAEHCLADDIEFYPAPGWPGPRVYSGLDEVVAFLKEEVTPVIGLSQVQIENEAVVGDTVVFRLATTVDAELGDMHLSDVPVFHVTTIRNGRVARIRAFWEEGDAMQAARAG
jgi:ketosteroid isomerase-like protein